jgi:Domain of unknown function (DUF4136)
MRIARVLFALAVGLLGSSASAQNVSHDYDKSAEFSRFKTYAWVPGTNLKDEINHKRVVAAIDAQLTAKGFRKVEASAHPDLLVAYHATFDKDLRITGFSSGWGGYRFGGHRSGTATTDTIVTGTLVVDMVDAQSGSIVWRGVASKEIDPKASPERREKNINKAAEKLFKSYPPQSRG